VKKIETEETADISFILYLISEDTAIPCLTLGVTFFIYTVDIKTALCNNLEKSVRTK
jgi:hypothetical protein